MFLLLVFCLTGRVISTSFKSFFHAVPMSMQQRRFVWLMIESHRTKKLSLIIFLSFFHSFIHSERQHCSSYCIIGRSRRSCQIVSQTSRQYQLSIPKWILSFVHGSTYVLFYQSYPSAQNIDLCFFFFLVEENHLEVVKFLLANGANQSLATEVKISSKRKQCFRYINIKFVFRMDSLHWLLVFNKVMIKWWRYF